MNKIKIIRRIITLFLAIILLGIAINAYQTSRDTMSIVRAFGPLKVTFPSTPMFSETNWLPGKTVTKSIEVENTDLYTRTVGIEAYNFSDSGTPELSQALFIIISENGTVLYGQGSETGIKTLSDFYNGGPVWLSKVAKRSKTTYVFTVSMDPAAGNQYQDKSTIFDIVAGVDSADRAFPTFAPLPTLKPLPTLNTVLPTLRTLPTLRPLPTFRPLPTLRSLR